MVTALNEQLDEIILLTQSDPDQVIVEALRQGMKQVYQYAVLRAYLQGKISRNDATKKLGLSVVLRAEEEHQAVLEDLNWGLGGMFRSTPAMINFLKAPPPPRRRGVSKHT